VRLTTLLPLKSEPVDSATLMICLPRELAEVVVGVEIAPSLPLFSRQLAKVGVRRRSLRDARAEVMEGFEERGVILPKLDGRSAVFVLADLGW
jgi:hypothetical protein